MLMRSPWHWLSCVAIALVCASPVFAADLTFPGGSVTLKGGDSALSSPVKVALFLTALSFIPALVVAATGFTRIIVVLAMLRQAIGMASTPPNSVLVSLALFLTLFSMSPMLEKMDATALQPYLDGKISEKAAFSEGQKPLKEFLVTQTREKDIALIMELARKPLPETAMEVELLQLLPAFMLSELRTAFEIGFIIFLPFILIDIIVASVLMSLGMIMVPPMSLSLPLKILMFVLIDGWSLLAGALVGSFH